MTIEDALNEDTQKDYLVLFRSGDIVRAETLKKNSGIELVINDDAKTAIQEGYSRQFENLLDQPHYNYSNLLQAIKDLENFTGVAPENKQKIYDELTKRGQNDSYWSNLAKSMKSVLEMQSD